MLRKCSSDVCDWIMSSGCKTLKYPFQIEKIISGVQKVNVGVTNVMSTPRNHATSSGSLVIPFVAITVRHPLTNKSISKINFNNLIIAGWFHNSFFPLNSYPVIYNQRIHRIINGMIFSSVFGCAEHRTDWQSFLFAESYLEKKKKNTMVIESVKYIRVFNSYTVINPVFSPLVALKSTRIKTVANVYIFSTKKKNIRICENTANRDTRMRPMPQNTLN